MPSPLPAAALALALVVPMAAAAATHHAHVRHATPAHQHPQAREKAAPHGAAAVPPGGTKLYCGRGNPLLVRKMKQGAGTTVTVICR